MANILLVRDSEILPLTGKEKKLRMAMLADTLVSRGHEVTWFCSTFNHMRKQYHFKEDTEVKLGERYRIVLKNAGSYKRNLSFQRIKHHKKLAKRLRCFLEENKNSYDIVIVSHPIIELAKETVDFCNRLGLPVLVDVRDKWPDTFSGHFPRYLRPMVKLLTAKMVRQTKQSFSRATRVVSMSKYMLDWSLSYGGRSENDGDVFYLGSSLSGGARLSCHITPQKTRLTCTFVGGLIHSYDIQTVLSTSESIKDHAEFTIVGDGPLKSRLLPYFTKPNIYFAGWCNKNEVLGYLSSADILLFPLSRSLSQDVLPNKFFDYLWAAKPILASCKGEMADLIRDHNLGYVYQFGDRDDFLKGLDYLSDPLVRQNISVNMRRLYQERFSAEKIYNQYADLIQSYL
mgnify:CR=1 FL=1